MYELVSAIVKPLDNNGRWRSMDIGNVHFSELYRNFKRVLVTLSHPVLEHNVSLDLENLRTTLGAEHVTVRDWLILNGNNTLPTSNELPVINTRYAKFSDAIRSGYHVQPKHPTISIDSPLPIEDKTNLLVTKTGVTSYEFIYRHVLVNVNGFYHLADWNSQGLHVVDGMRSCLKSGRNEIGLLSFLELGSLDFIPIRPDMIYRHREGQQIKSNCYIDTGVDLSDKTVMLVLGGYLHVLDSNVFFRTGLSTFGVNFGNVPLVDRFYESNAVLDLSHLPMSKSPHNPDQISINELYSDAVLTHYLTMSQSFLVVLDNADIFVDQLPLQPSPWPGCYTSYTTPIYPMVVGRGKHEIYWPRKEHDRFSVNVNASWKGKPIYETVRTLKQQSVDAAEIPVAGYQNIDANFLLIGSDI